MPWTFAHPAAVLPLRRLCPRWLSLPGLIVGSLTPDLGYYGGRLDLASISHTPFGIVVCCLPLGLLLLALLMRFSRPLTVLLPSAHRQLVRGQLEPPARPVGIAFVVAVQSILLGAISHVLWDSFTHAGRWGVSLFPFLAQHLFDAGGRQIRLFNVLQHVSTVVGLVAMAIIYRRAARLQARSPGAPSLDAWRSRTLVAGVACSALLGVLVAFTLASAQPASLSIFVVRTVVWGSTCFAALFLIGSLIWWRRFGDA